MSFIVPESKHCFLDYNTGLVSVSIKCNEKITCGNESLSLAGHLAVINDIDGSSS